MANLVNPLVLDAPIVNELALLASQHHHSEYNRLKFGPKGCPITYIPLSLCLPDYFLQLQDRQQQCARQRDWWPCDTTPTSPVILGSLGAQAKDSHLQQEIQAAMSEPLHNLPLLPNGPNYSIKTSSTHPINPTVFEIPYSFTLDRLLSPSTAQLHTICPERSASFPQPQIVTNHLRTRQKVTEALQAAMSASFSPPSTLSTEGKLRISPIARHHSANDTLPSDQFVSFKHSNTSSVSLSLSLTISDPPSLSRHATRKTLLSKGSISSLKELGIVQSLPAPVSSPEPPLLIGNLFLSSCPGKKVRLEGPVKGRSGVCRDLNLDLRRMKELGVGCLDDGELHFLGAPWPEYERLAKTNGIDVLRIPIPEGLAPLSPESLDASLTKVINTYSLNGIPVLVHCRGGVGRAGVIACCWLVRLGLCGWIEPLPSSIPEDTSITDLINPALYPSESGAIVPDAEKLSSPRIRADTVQFVQKVIAVARRRRSLKAIETYEQVRFLVDFVEYLREKKDALDE
ncbi:hypothetical protein H0H92_004221 [Tricholoma furcatifolium]|nr:hypothetical protein H0H92_004221 [Tricholoma furcatifolium]